MPAENDALTARLASFRKVQPLVQYAAAHLDEELPLAVLAGQGGLSAFHMHRVFSAVCGETPKQLVLRLRIERAAALLLGSRDTILDVALACGFQSHEVFLRAFRRHLGVTPSAYRRHGFARSIDTARAATHLELVREVGPCLKLYHIGNPRRIETMYAMTVKELPPQSVLVMQRRVKHAEIGAALGEMLGHIFVHAQQAGLALAGQPFTRYLEWGPGLVTMEAGLPIVSAGESSAQDTANAAAGEPEIAEAVLPGGRIATTLHVGVYEKLPEAHAALEQWIADQGLVSAGPPWEVYITDPADFPDPADWKTELFWPVAPRE